jgi:hypothetical protein
MRAYSTTSQPVHHPKERYLFEYFLQWSEYIPSLPREYDESTTSLQAAEESYDLPQPRSEPLN